MNEIEYSIESIFDIQQNELKHLLERQGELGWQLCGCFKKKIMGDILYTFIFSRVTDQPVEELSFMPEEPY